MKLFTQCVFTALVLGSGITTAFADDVSADLAKFSWSGCTTTEGCSLEIPIKLVVDKKCEVTGGGAIDLKSTGGSVSKDYTVTTNTPYILNISTANAGTKSSTFVKHNTDPSKTISTTITTSGPKGLLAWGNTNMVGSSSDKYTVTVANNAVSATQLAGTYTDTYKVNVSY
ncbi:hypothetical protein [Acinetobacter sp. MD2]|uniref:hypothetical protein n=1 Tax=Acinetobacter sp. MD2 TaxID=2600066 RepID=UPI002D1E9BEB|nr:hypothetical protein [Acinetobacter sp. MD2]MEB3767319.1 hypothetical protein [Acinetobacter sp. MD2]